MNYSYSAGHRQKSQTSRLLALGALLSFSSGCSFIFSKGPPDDYQETGYFDCSGYTLPVIDTVWAGLNGIGAFNAATADESSWKEEGSSYDRSTVTKVGLTWLAISGASAIYGYYKANKCSEAKEYVISNQVSPYMPARRPRYAPPPGPRSTAPANPSTTNDTPDRP